MSALGRESFVTHAGMAKLMQSLQRDGIPENFSTTTQFRARKSLAAEQTPYGPLVKTFEIDIGDKKPHTMAVQQPLPFIWWAAKHSEDYSAALVKALAKGPSSPSNLWRLICYQDGVDPGDTQGPKHTRHSVVFYWTFLEFGADLLSREQLWATPVVLRTRIAKKLPGQIAQLFNIVLKGFFGADGHDICHAGVTVDLYDGTRRVKIFAKLGVVLADEPALKEMLSLKGHQGLKPCILCLNATLYKTPHPPHLRTHLAVPIIKTKLADFTVHTSESMREMVRRLDQYKVELTPAELHTKEQIFGLAWNPYSVMADPQLQVDPVTTLMYDWAHVTVSDGVADVEFGMFMRHMRLNKTGTDYDDFRKYLELWSLPGRAGDLLQLFTPSANKNNFRKGSFTSTASEFLTLVPILDRYLTNVVIPRGRELPYVRSMLAVLNTVELLQAVRRGTVTDEELRAAIERHLELFVAAWGVDCMRPKHHYMLHLAEMLRFFGILISTLPNERRHRLVKRYCRPRQNAKAWDVGVVEEITTHQLWELSNGFLGAGTTSAAPTPRILRALQDVVPGAPLEGCRLHRQIEAQDGKAVVGDAVFFDLRGARTAGELLLNFSINDGATKLSIVSVWSPRPTHTTALATFERGDSQAHIIESSAVGVALYRTDAVNAAEVSVIVPWSWRKT